MPLGFLKLKNVHFEDQTGEHSQEYSVPSKDNPFKEQESQLEQYSLLFDFQDGKINQICANQDEDIWVANVKRGIISLLQNSLDDLTTSGVTNEAIHFFIYFL